MSLCDAHWCTPPVAAARPLPRVAGRARAPPPPPNLFSENLNGTGIWRQEYGRR